MQIGDNKEWSQEKTERMQQFIKNYKNMYRAKEIFSIIEITKESTHGVIKHYGINGSITQPEQVKDHVFIVGQSRAEYGEYVVLNEWDNAVRVISKHTLEEEYESISK